MIADSKGIRDDSWRGSVMGTEPTTGLRGGRPKTGNHLEGSEEGCSHPYYPARSMPAHKPFRFFPFPRSIAFVPVRQQACPRTQNRKCHFRRGRQHSVPHGPGHRQRIFQCHGFENEADANTAVSLQKSRNRQKVTNSPHRSSPVAHPSAVRLSLL